MKVTKEDRERRRKVRFTGLHRFYCEKHGGQEPQDSFDRFFLEVIIRLGAVYDQNWDSRHQLLILPEHSVKTVRLLRLYGRREKFMAKLSEELRKAIGIYVRGAE